MVDIAERVASERLSELATPANMRLGRAVLSEGGVTIVARGAARIDAKVGGTTSADGRRTVVLAIDDGRLTWSCTCTRRPELFCKHCVAAALAVAQD
jgi:uncharacterized Zn finger protein